MRITIALLLAVSSFSASAQTSIVNFSLPDVAGDTVSLDSYPSTRGIVVIFTGNQCAYDNLYTARIKSLIDLYSGKIQFLLINSSPEAAESVDKMKAKYVAWGIHVPYLADKNQKALNLFDVKKSPEVFLLRKKEDQFIIVYRGALDDNPQVAADVKQPYLKTSIELFLVGQQIEAPTTRVVGCSIRKK